MKLTKTSTMVDYTLTYEVDLPTTIINIPLNLLPENGEVYDSCLMSSDGLQYTVDLKKDENIFTITIDNGKQFGPGLVCLYIQTLEYHK